MDSQNENTIHAALGIYDPKGTFSQYAGVVMTSIFEHTKSPVCVHILHDATLTERNRALLTETAEIFSQKAEFHDISVYMAQLGDATVRSVKSTGGSVGMLFRLAIPSVLPLEKLIYLDCDIVVNMDIKELWDVPLDGHSCAGAPDVCSPFSLLAFRMKLMGCDRERYVNSGVLLMNPVRMKEKLEPRQVASWFARHGHHRKSHDQDLLNSCFRGDIKALEHRFNNINGGAGVGNSIVHMLNKPWEEMTCSPMDRLYWGTFLKTPWGRFPRQEDLIEAMLDTFRQSPFTHRHTAQCYGKIFNRMRSDVLRNKLFKFVSIIVMELYVRIKLFIFYRK